MRARALPRASVGRGRTFEMTCQVNGSAAAPGPATSFWCFGAARAGILGSDETKATNEGFRSAIGSSERVCFRERFAALRIVIIVVIDPTTSQIRFPGAARPRTGREAAGPGAAAEPLTWQVISKVRPLPMDPLGRARALIPPRAAPLTLRGGYPAMPYRIGLYITRPETGLVRVIVYHTKWLGRYNGIKL